MNKITLRNLLIISSVSAAIGAIVGYIASRRRRIYFSKDDVEYVNPIDIDIPIDVLMDEETM